MQPPPPPANEPPANKYMDPKGKDYKRASRSYTGLVVGLPFLIVTSIYLYKRGKSMLIWPFMSSFEAPGRF